MGWYLRKSFSAGPVRFNLSKSGIGTSFGVKGARISMGPRGAYLHAGRGGLYFRESLNGPRALTGRSSSQESAYAKAAQPRAFFDAAQIDRRKLIMEVKLKDASHAGLLFFLSVLLFSASAFLADYKNYQVSFVALGGLLLFISSILKFQFLVHKWSAHSLYKSAKKMIFKKTTVFDLNAVEKISASNIKKRWKNYAALKLYIDVLQNFLRDAKLGQEEKVLLEALEKEINDIELARKVKTYVFHQAYLSVIADNVLSAEEDAEIFRIKTFLALSDEDVQEQTVTLQRLREVRGVQNEGLKSVAASISLQKDEICYHQTHGRLVKEKVVQTFQRDGVRHKITDWDVECEGDLFLTSKRIIIVADGVRSIRLDKIFDLETDIDKNALSLSIDGRKSLMTLTVPDSLVVSAKLNKLLEETRTS